MEYSVMIAAMYIFELKTEQEYAVWSQDQLYPDLTHDQSWSLC
jgi:hypothetical protein